MTPITAPTIDRAGLETAMRTLRIGCASPMIDGWVNIDDVDPSHTPMSKSLTLCFSLSLLIPTVVSGGSYRTGIVYRTRITNAFDHNCGDRVYDPEIFALPTGDLRLLAQGNSDSLTDY